jgi:putative transposase
MIAFIDANRERRTDGGLRWGVEPICAVLPIAPQTYHAAKSRPPSARAVRDEELKPQIVRVYDANLQVYGSAPVLRTINQYPPVPRRPLRAVRH